NITCASSSFFFLTIPPPPRSTLFPYTTLFRSRENGASPRDRRLASRGLRTAPLVEEIERQSSSQKPDPSADLRHSFRRRAVPGRDRKSTRLNSSHVAISYAVFCLKKKKYKTRY